MARLPKFVRNGWEMLGRIYPLGGDCWPRRCGSNVMKRRDFLQTVCWTTAAFSLARSARAQEPNIMRDEIMVPSSDPGIEIFVRNKRPANLSAFSPARTLLFVHGATYPASSSFDLDL